MTFFQFLIGCLATYRLTVLVSRDLGPWDIFKKLRAHSYWLQCPFCFSISAGAFVEAAYYFSGVKDSIVMASLISLAFSAASIILDQTWTSSHLPK